MNMKLVFLASLMVLLVLPQPGRAEDSPTLTKPEEIVRAREAAFAASMAQRDHESFQDFLAEEAVFFGSREVLQGKAEIAAGWMPYFEGETSPFSWQPEVVVVLPSGSLAHSSGPVFDAAGKQVGSFNSIWRKEADGTWMVVFDKGCPVCSE